MVDDPSDRRTRHRAECSFSIRVEAGTSGTEERHPAVCRDLSATGLRALVPEALAAGSQVQVAVPIDDEELTATGSIVRCSPLQDPEGDLRYEVAISLTHSHPMFEKVLGARVFALELERMHDLIEPNK